MPTRYLLLTALGFLFPCPRVPAQSPAAPIQQLFAGMRTADTTGLARLFHPEATLKTVTDRGTRATPIPRFLEYLAGTEAGALNEEVHYIEVREDGGLATAWVPYTFVRNGEISHCGVNSFRLLRAGDGRWQIHSIVDTRQREGCRRVDTRPVSEAIHELSDRWHRAAAEADSTTFFDLMTDEAVYIGTDSTEHWTKAEFLSFAAPYFARGQAWAFTPTQRHVFPTDSGDIAYWDELLDTWMGKCRGTGIARRGKDRVWRVAHYTLSVTVPNEKVEAFILLTK